jgi:hypothetical protein
MAGVVAATTKPKPAAQIVVRARIRFSFAVGGRDGTLSTRARKSHSSLTSPVMSQQRATIAARYTVAVWEGRHNRGRWQARRGRSTTAKSWLGRGRRICPSAACAQWLRRQVTTCPSVGALLDFLVIARRERKPVKHPRSYDARGDPMLCGEIPVR